MIDRAELESKAAEFQIHVANVERDYVFGWILAVLYGSSPLGGSLTLKGGNCFRKAYFPATRFSSDLDFSTHDGVDTGILEGQLNDICREVQAATGVQFVTERTKAEEKPNADRELRLYQARIYFKDFYGNPDTITISVRVDVTAFDRLYLPVQSRTLIHPYSDAAQCVVDIKRVKLEELLALKLKCLLQRRHLADMYDLVYGIFLNREIAVDRGEVLQNFLQRTIFSPSPGMARVLLLELPLEAFRAVWRNYIVCPVASFFDFDVALTGFKQVIESIFGSQEPGYWGERAFFPSNLRNPIMEAASNQVLIELDYHGRRRKVEPYALTYKRRRDGAAREYFYGYDQTGGRSSEPGIKTFLHTDIAGLRVTDERFDPRFPVELSKASEPGSRSYFGSPFGGRGHSRGLRAALGPRWVYTIECSYCNRRFERLKASPTLRIHKNAFGSECYGRSGLIVDQHLA